MFSWIALDVHEMYQQAVSHQNYHALECILVAPVHSEGSPLLELLKTTGNQQLLGARGVFCFMEIWISTSVCYASGRMSYLFISYDLGLIARSAGSAASAFIDIDGVLHRETSKWNRNWNDIPEPI